MNKTTDKSTDVLLGIDVGSTNIKCVAIDVNGNLLFKASEPTDIYRVCEGMARSIDGDILIESISRVCSKVMSHLKTYVGSPRILGVGTASLGCEAVFLDEEDKQIYPPASDEKQHDVMPDGCFEITGYPENYGNTGYNLVRLNRKFPGWTSKIHSLLSVADYVNFRLTGVKLRDFSSAGSMSMMELLSGKWWDEFLNASGIEPKALCKVANSGTEVGRILPSMSAKTGIPEGTKIFLGGHDYLCAAFATGCRNNNRLLNVLGTFEMLASFHDRPLNNIPREGIRVFIDHHTYPNLYSLASEVICGGQLEWLRGLLGSGKGGLSACEWDNLFKELDDLGFAAGSSGYTGLFIPRVFGDQFPYVDPHTSAAFLGLSPGTRPVNLLRAAILGLCYLSRDMFEFHQQAVSKQAAKMTEPEIHVVGGGSRSRFWIQIKADIIGKTLVVPHIEEATATGAALLAGVGARVYGSYDEATDLYSGRGKDIYEPNMERHEMFNEIYNGIYRPSLEFFKKMDYKLMNLLKN